MRLLTPLLALILTMPVAAADDPPAPPPTDLAGSYDEGDQTLHLSWSAPGPGNYTYHVYRDGALLGDATNTTFTDAVDAQAHIYTVTVDNGEHESLPSNPYFFTRIPGHVGVPGDGCSVIRVIIDDDPPAVDPAVYPECLPGLPLEQNVIALRPGN